MWTLNAVNIMVLVAVALTSLKVKVCYGSANHVKDNSKIICNKDHFIKNYVDLNISFNSGIYRKYWEACKDTTKSCKSGSVESVYAENTDTREFFYLYRGTNFQPHDTDCWGEIMVVTYDNGTMQNYINFNRENKTHEMLIVKVIPKFKYIFQLYTIPYGPEYGLNLTLNGPTACENTVLETIYKMQYYDGFFGKCNGSPEFNSLYGVANKICKIQPTDAIARENFCRTYLTEVNCRLSLNYTPPAPTPKKPLLSKTSIVLSATSAFLLIFLTIAFFCYRKYKKQDVLILKTSNLQTSKLIHLEGIKRLEYDVSSSNIYIEEACTVTDDLY